MAWPSARFKSYAATDSFPPGDVNSIQDQYVRTTGILGDDLDAATLNAILGLNQTASHIDGAKTRRGKSIIPGTDTRTNAAYGTLATPDQVSNVVLPTNGLLAVLYQATWQENQIGTGQAAIFIGANQLKTAKAASGPPVVQETTLRTQAANTDNALATFSGGLRTINDGTAYTSDVTTGQVVGLLGSSSETYGPCYIFAAAGTYTISVQFKAANPAAVVVKDRKLWVWTIGF